jgi:hypothetical protein
LEKLSRRAFISGLLSLTGSAAVSAIHLSCRGKAPEDRTDARHLSVIAETLIRDLTADADGSGQAARVISDAAARYPADLYNLLVTADALARDLSGTPFAASNKEARAAVIRTIYQEEGPLKRFCALLIRMYYDETHQWKIIGYKLAPHKKGFLDPEFDAYEFPADMMETGL